MADGAILPLPQKHQADHNHSCYGHGYHQQTNQRAAAEAEVLIQGPEGSLTGGFFGWEKKVGEKEQTMKNAKLSTDVKK